MAHVVVTTTLPVLDCLWLEKYCTLMLRTISTRRKVRSLKFLQGKHVPPFPSHSHETQWPTRRGKVPHHKTAKMFTEAKFERLRQKPAHLTMACRSTTEKPNQPRPSQLRIALGKAYPMLHGSSGLPLPPTNLCKKRDISSPDPCNPMTYNASFLTWSA